MSLEEQDATWDEDLHASLVQDLIAHYHGKYLHFNDSAVTPMALRDIEKSFEGAKSAVVLVYRQEEDTRSRNFSQGEDKKCSNYSKGEESTRLNSSKAEDTKSRTTSGMGKKAALTVSSSSSSN